MALGKCRAASLSMMMLWKAEAQERGLLGSPSISIFRGE